MCQLIRKIFPCCETKTFFNQIQYGKKPEEICCLRTQNCLEWYVRKAIYYKYMFYILSIINLALPLLSALIIVFNEKSNMGAILAAIASLSASLLALYNARDKWTNYRTAAENIKKQYSLYCGKVAPYDDENAHTRYLLMLEQYMSEVHLQWYNTQKKDTSTNTETTIT